MVTRVSTSLMRLALLGPVGVIASIGLGACRADVVPEERISTAVQDLQAADLVGTTLPSKTLALTFDDGPGLRAAELSMYLKAQNIRAVFFVNGARIAATTLPNTNTIDVTPGAAGMLAQIIADGHLVANHTVTHRDMVTEVLPTGGPKLIQELTETDTDMTGYVPSGRFLFRAPYGSYSVAVYNALKVSPMNKYVGPINWDMGGNSDQYPNSAADWACWQGQLKNAVGGTLANGNGYATTTQCGDAYMKEITAVGHGIVLMHDPYFYASGNTIDMVKYLVPKLKAAGYSFVRADEVPAITALLPPCDPTCATCLGITSAQCSTCGPGRTFNAGSCPMCSTCPAGKYASVACTPTADTTCTACNAGCATCTGPAATDCSSCASGTFLKAGACSTCTKCAVGTYESVPCSGTADATCAACDPSCATCTGPAASQCGACPTGRYASAGACRACTVCPAGTHETAACAADKDTACAPCDPGTFAASPGATTCAPCGAGTGSGSGATACTPGGGPGGTNNGSGGGAGADAGTGDTGGQSGCNVSQARGNHGMELLAGGALAAALLRRRRSRPDGNVKPNHV